jgi:5'-deoxynucleotidase
MFHFFAYISRMKLIDRWSLMRCTQRENVQEHSLQVAVIAHALALIKNKFYGGDLVPSQVALVAMYHDATEVITGDLPTPVKYFSNEILTAYHALEGHAVDQLVRMLPEELKSEYNDLFSAEKSNSEIRTVIKAADTLSAYIKCLEEESAGNHEFSLARKTIESKVTVLCSRPEVAYFVEHFIPSFSLTLDEISRPR